MTGVDPGREAFARRRWRQAYDELTAADSASSLAPEQLERLATAAHCLGKDEESVELWQRAYSGHLDAGDLERAAMAAAWCSFGLLTRGQVVLAGGWLGRARSLWEDHALTGPIVGFVKGQAAATLMMSGDPDAALSMFDEALRESLRVRDPNGIVLGHLGMGQALTLLGRGKEGVQILDQAMVGLSADDVSPLVAGLAYCAGIGCCQLILDVGRAQTWTAALTQWCDAQPDLVPYRGNCLVHRAEILTLHGDWPAAHVEAERARVLLADSPSVSGVGDAYYQLGELYRLRGEYADAEVAYKNASKNGRDTQPGLGLLRLAQGHPESAAASIRRALEETPAGIARVRLLRAQVEVALTVGDLAAARAAADGLGALAEGVGVPLIQAQALQADGEVALAQGQVQPALIRLREAWKIWQDLAAPHDAARTRMLIAAACRALGDDESAELELDAARWTFTELGAAPDLARARQLSQRTGAAAPGPSSLRERGLSLREAQVLRLVAAGKTNRAIATELFLSEKTVHRHLSNIFAKLDVSSRSAATAYAFQHGLV